jgi:hypothetical protein
VRVPPIEMQPLAARDVSAALADVVLGEPLGDVHPSSPPWTSERRIAHALAHAAPIGPAARLRQALRWPAL